ncbi:MAG: hemerythrin domain-containing protein [Gammaproteobacteria bacterium]|nr:hemerythrin domain-containing protein [Gammaproteobacteria bacterium]MCY4210828.1 hemerythrin domain-containing protein [Gammaproteobacteria bacterium]MCY4281302.1 hemerythrin domain-containing protein [Gammaproteobacteria bacterium]MCY4338602.1 hemerythrin domain-containing protein [Gammaproteobacteria bacterium]
MAALIDTLQRDHKNYAQLLSLLSREADKLDAGDAPDFVLMYDIMNYMVNYPDLHHHPHEELIFEVLGALDPDCLADVGRLTEEHQQQAATGLALKDSLDAVVNGAIVPLDSILRRTRAYIDLFRRHISLEQGSVFPKAKATLEDSEWQLINDKISQVEDPLFGEVALGQYRKLYEGIVRGNL